MNDLKLEQKAKHGGARIPSKGNLYAHAAMFGEEVIDFLLDTMRDPKAQISVRISAANKLIDKLLSNRNTMEGDSENPLVIEDKTPYTPEQAKIIREGVARIMEQVTKPPPHVHDSTCDPNINPRVCPNRG